MQPKADEETDVAKFTWAPMYAELADKLLAFRTRQGELIALIERMRARELPVIGLEDRYPDGTSGTLKEIDPFTFFANFNRGLTDNNRRVILSEIKDALQLQAAVPSDFSGIPVGNNQAAWYFAYAKDRPQGDIDALWDIAAAARAGGPEQMPSGLFERALAVREVAIPKLTIGLFWVRPDKYVSLDRHMVRYLLAHGVDAAHVEDLRGYLAVIAATREKLGADFKQLSLDAWIASQKPVKRYWAGGFLWGGDRSKLDEFVAGSYWQHGYPRTTDRRKGQKTWELFDQVKVGDELAIKGYGGRNVLKIYFVGEVTGVDRDQAKVHLRKLDRPHFHGQGPKGAAPGWFDTLTEVREPEAIEVVFRGRQPGVHPSGPPPPVPAELSLARNLILFGPPGTGKTYQLRQIALKYFTDQLPTAALDAGEAEALQSLPVWHVIALALEHSHGMTVPELMQHPFVVAKSEASDSKHFTAQLWVNLQTHTKQDCKDVSYTRRREPLIFWKDEQSRWTVDADLLSEVIEPTTGARGRASPAATGRRYDFVTFHQSYSYEDFIEGIRPEVDEDGTVRYEVIPGAFRRMVKRAQNDEKLRPHAIFIDEINRGNVAKIFGELITLLEEDKRDGEDNALSVQLPYSRESFSVPPNLWVIGSMNTADRSIALLDSALRRRFEFQQLLPDSDVVRGLVGDNGVVGGIDVARLFEIINERIEFLYDRDHTLGHSYFLNVDTLDDLKSVFIDRVIPLLQEYFYDDWEKLCLVLGCPPAAHDGEGNPNPIIERQVMNATVLFGTSMSDLEDRRYRYQVSRAFKGAAGQSLAAFFVGVQTARP